jgi:transcriptional antiterminator NusG
VVKRIKVKAYIETGKTRNGGYVSQVLVPTEKVTVKEGKKIVKDKVYFFPVYVMINLVGEILILLSL